MATVNIKFFRAHIIPGVTAVYGIDTVEPESFTSSAVSQVTTASATDNDTYARVVSYGGNVWIKIGDNPTAVSEEGTLILDELPEIFKLRDGDKIALID